MPSLTAIKTRTPGHRWPRQHHSSPKLERAKAIVRETGLHPDPRSLAQMYRGEYGELVGETTCRKAIRQVADERVATIAAEAEANGVADVPQVTNIDREPARPLAHSLYQEMELQRLYPVVLLARDMGGLAKLRAAVDELIAVLAPEIGGGSRP